MTEEELNQISQKLATMLSAQTASAPTTTVPGMAPGVGMMPAGQMMAPPSQTPQPCSVSIPLEFNLPDGCTLRCYLHFDAAWCQQPQTIIGLVEQLQFAGWPLSTWRPKNSNWQGGSGGWNRGRGYGRRY